MPLFAVCKRFVIKSGEKGEWEEEDKNREREGEKRENGRAEMRTGKEEGRERRKKGKWGSNARSIGYERRKL